MRRWLIVGVLGMTALIAPAAPASAHAALEYTLPADGAAVGEPVSQIQVAFDDPVALIGNGFDVLDPQGNVIEPFAVTDDDMLFRLQLDPPLYGGVVGVRYKVSADDGHVLEGSFTFTVAADALPTVPPTAPITVAPTDPPTAAPTVASSAPPTQPTTAPASTSAPTTQPLTVATLPVPQDGDASDSSSTRTLVIVGALVVAALAAGTLVVRARRTDR